MAIVHRLMEIDSSDDKPWMLAADKEHQITFLLGDQKIEKHRDGGPDGKWSCYRVDFMSASCMEEDCFCVDASEPDELCLNAEIPFWAMKAFELFIKGSKSKNGVTQGIYARGSSGKQNIAMFELA